LVIGTPDTFAGIILNVQFSTMIWGKSGNGIELTVVLRKIIFRYNLLQSIKKRFIRYEFPFIVDRTTASGFVITVTLLSMKGMISSGYRRAV